MFKALYQGKSKGFTDLKTHHSFESPEQFIPLISVKDISLENLLDAFRT